MQHTPCDCDDCAPARVVHAPLTAHAQNRLLTMPYGTPYVGVIGGPLLIRCVCGGPHWCTRTAVHTQSHSLIAAITLYCFLLVVKTKNIYHARGR